MREEEIAFLMDEMQSMEERIYEKIKEEGRLLRNRCAKIENDVRKINLVLSNENYKKMFDEMEAGVKQSHRRAQAEISRMCMFTEVLRLYPNKLREVLVALDNSDEWFKERDFFSLKQWVEEVDKNYEKNKHFIKNKWMKPYEME